MPDSPSARSDAIQSEAERIGQAILDLSARLPEGYHDIGTGHEKAQAQLYVGYDAGDEVWEIEFCVLDPERNRIVQDRDLNTALWRVLSVDRKRAPHV